MPRKRAPTFEAQREDILAAAARLFADQGFSATSMNQVAEACGVAKPTLYHYFQDKQELLAQSCEIVDLDCPMQLVRDVDGGFGYHDGWLRPNGPGLWG